MGERLYRRGAVWWCWYYGPDGRQRRESTRCTDRRAASRVLRDREREAQDTNPHHAAGRAPFLLSHALDELVNADTVGRSTDTLEMYAKKGGHLLRLLGDFDLGVLRLEDVEAYVTKRLTEKATPDKLDGKGRVVAEGRPLERETVRKELTTLRQALQIAKKRGAVRFDPRSVIPEFRVRYVPRERYLTEAEFGRLLGTVAERRRLWLMLAVYSGGRLSEVEAARWEDIDWRDRTMLLRGTKTKKARRRVPVPDPLRKALEPLRDRIGTIAGAWSNVRRDLAKACAKAKTAKTTPNDLRRTYASWLKQAGVDSLVVAQLLGHSSTRMVELVYGKLDAATLKRATAKLPAPKRAAGGRRR